MDQPNLSAFIWQVADLLRGDYKQSEYGKVILPLTVLRRLDWVLEATKGAVLAEHQAKQQGVNTEPTCLGVAGQHGLTGRSSSRLRKNLNKLTSHLSQMSFGSGSSWMQTSTLEEHH